MPEPSSSRGFLVDSGGMKGLGRSGCGLSLSMASSVFPAVRLLKRV